jgi:chromosome segregation ATPase
MDQELIAYLDTRFTTIDRRFSEMDERFSEMDVRMNGLEEAIRHTDVKVEALRGDIRLVADGVAAVDQKLDAFRGEVAKEFEDVKAQNRASYAQVERRVSRLEQRAQLG